MVKLRYRTPSLGRGIMLAAMSLGLVTILIAGTGTFARAGHDPGFLALDRALDHAADWLVIERTVFDDLFIVETAPVALHDFDPAPVERPHASATRLPGDAGVIPLTGGAAPRAPPLTG